MSCTQSSYIAGSIGSQAVRCSIHRMATTRSASGLPAATVDFISSTASELFHIDFWLAKAIARSSSKRRYWRRISSVCPGLAPESIIFRWAGSVHIFFRESSPRIIHERDTIFPTTMRS